MDPDAAYEAMNDLTADLEDRAHAALDLLVWLAKGGWAPGENGAAFVALEAETIVIGYQEEILVCGERIDGNEPGDE